jgi:ribonuclease E
MREMTFVEAAIEVLRREGKPLPIRQLAELAVKLNLLSVVGRDPEGTMQMRLSDAVESDRSDLIEVRPGVYGLRLYPEKPQDAVAAPAEAATTAEEAPSPRRRSRRGAKKSGTSEKPALAEPAEEAEGKKKRRRGRRGGRG